MTKSTKSHLRRSLLDISLSFPTLPKRAQRLGSVSVQTSYTPATPFYAGVEPAHTRICSTTSCDVFARVVERKPWGETDFTFLLCPPPALTCHARFLRLSRVCGRSSKEECLPLFVLFVLFGQAKSTLCFMYFCVTKSTKSHLRRSLLEISLPFPALPKCEQYIPSCANISSEPSDRRQRQKYRFKCTGCLLDFALCHADIRQGFPPYPSALSASALSAHKLHARPPLLYMRAWNQRIRESARHFRVMCSHAWYG